MGGNVRQSARQADEIELDGLTVHVLGSPRDMGFNHPFFDRRYGFDSGGPHDDPNDGGPDTNNARPVLAFGEVSRQPPRPPTRP